MNMFVLTDNDNDPLGVFNSAEIPKKQIAGHFGRFEILQFIDIDDSGLQWQLTIKTKDGEKHHLTMHYFTLNEI